VVEKLLATDDEQQLRAVLLLNNWWHERNQVREGERRRSPNDIALLCGRQAIEIQNLRSLLLLNQEPELEEVNGKDLQLACSN
jgi:hypothetical protein